MTVKTLYDKLSVFKSDDNYYYIGDRVFYITNFYNRMVITLCSLNLYGGYNMNKDTYLNLLLNKEFDTYPLTTLVLKNNHEEFKRFIYPFLRNNKIDTFLDINI